MAKIRATIEADEMTIVLPVEARKSASGKTLVIASTRGNIRTGLDYKGNDVFLGVNAYVFPEDEA